MDNLEVVQRVTSVEEKTKSNSKRIDDLEVETKGIPRLEVLMEMMVKTNQEQVQTNKEFSQTIKEVNNNLSGLNSKMDNIDIRVETLEQSKKEVEADKKATKKEVLKNTIDLALKIIGGLILAYLVIAFNLNNK